MNDREKEEKEEIDFNEGLQFGLSHTVNNKKKNEATLSDNNKLLSSLLQQRLVLFLMLTSLQYKTFY